MTIQDFEDKFHFISGPALYGLWRYRQQALLVLSVRISRASPDGNFSDSKVYQILSGATVISTVRRLASLPKFYCGSMTSSCLDLIAFHFALSTDVSPIRLEIDQCGSCKFTFRSEIGRQLPTTEASFCP
jgi:hypothetical protein